jgi:hypothetical protein
MIENDPRSGIAWAQIAADIAWQRHPGSYGSAELESLLVEVARALDKHAISTSLDHQYSRFKMKDGKINVLHVMTKAIPTGGHTRAVAAWVRNAKDQAVHSLMITNQRGALPSWLTDAVTASGGKYWSLSKQPDVLGRAVVLRRVAEDWADVVVLHAHPFDALPMIAFGVDGGPPVVLFNHADHVFWLGASVADVVADLRPMGQHLSATRRGVRNSEILPLPLSGPIEEPSREVARRRLGIGNDTTVLLTISNERRYLPFGTYDFLHTMTGILQRNSKTVLIAVGPRSVGGWAESSALVGGRIKPMGPCTNLGVFYASADVYLPSYPLGGMTAMLDAGLRGVPVLGLYFSEAPHLSGADDIALDGLSAYTSSPGDYVAEIEKLISNPALRHERGRLIQERVRKIHVPPGWNEFLENVLNSLPSEHRVQMSTPSTSFGESDIFKAALDFVVSPRYTLNASYYAHALTLPLVERLSASLGLLVRTLRTCTSPAELFLETSMITYPLLPTALRPIIRKTSAPFVARIYRS